MKKNNNNKSNLKKNLMLYTSGPRSAGGPAEGRSARARALQTRGHPYQAWRRAGWQPAPPSTNLGVTGHPGPAAEARLVMKKKWAHIYTRLDAAPGGSRSADPWPSVAGLAPCVPAASQHRPTSDGTCNIFEKKKKKKKVILLGQ